MDPDSDISENENMELCTPPELVEEANAARNAVLPEKSSARYKQVYDKFIKWQQSRNISNLFTENILLAYFNQMSTSKSPNTLWACYSMLRCIINMKHKVDISKFQNLISFLKNKGKNYVPKKAKVFTNTEIEQFFKDAPDGSYLDTKVR